ncbi:hypothetical protein [Runella salmonicolor]|uniref:Tape measure domain-containing protein n=1 Tax=Runella salmonicolor TaxID=2950278 RepID=A0ABT1FST1_9BACT|nr:hypothetical protein [Runella salmonicolor]MCP1384820.1 hypothetical protein [Runella salmonicolor]
MIEEQVRFKVSAESDLPKVLSDLENLIQAQANLGSQGDKMSKKMQDAYRTQSLAIRDLTSTIQENYKEAQKSANGQSDLVGRQTKEFGALADSIKGVRNQLLAAFGVSELKSYIEKIFELTATYQKYQAALAVGLGNEKKAAEALEMLQQFADKTNFTLDELAETFTKFANRGLILSQQEMVKLGDVANALQKPFEQLGEAILDVNNTERWNELGIKAKTVGEKVQLTFKGVTLEVERTEKGVLGAIVAFGNLNGVAGQTEAQAKTLAGQYSTLQDSAAGLGRTIGNAMTPAFMAAIEASGGFIKIIAGSESAFTRTVTYLKAATAAIVTFMAATKAGAAAMVAKELVIKGYSLAIGTYNLAMVAAKGTVEGFTRAQIASAAAARTTWTALGVTPIGLLAGAIGVATTAYYAFKAANQEVNIEVDAATEKIIKEKVELTAAVSAVQGYSIGTKERAKAVQELMNKYPSMLSFMDAETVSNRQLNKALTEQIKLLDAKIKYSAAAATAEAIYQKEVDARKQQLEVIIKLRGAYKDLSDAFPDNDKFIAEIEKTYKAENARAASLQNSTTAAVSASWATMAYSKETAKYMDLQKETTALQTQMTTAIVEKSKASSQSTNAETDDINRQIKSLDSAHKQKKVNDEDYKMSRQKLVEELKRLNGEEVNNNDDTVKKLGKGQDEKKNKAIFTAKEIAVLTKKIQQDSIEEQLKLIDAQVELNIERINHSKLTKEQAEKAIIGIVEKAESDKAKIIFDNRAKIEAVELQHNGKIVSMSNETVKAKQKDEKELLEYIQKAKKEEQKIIEETTKIEKEGRQEGIKMALDYLSAQGGVLEGLGKATKQAFIDFDLLSGKSQQYFAQQRQDAEVAMNSAKVFFGETSKQYADAQVKFADAKQKEIEANIAAGKAKVNFLMMAAEIIDTIKGAIVGGIAEVNSAIIDIMIKTRDITKQYYNDMIQINESSLKAELEAFTGTHEQKTAIMESFYENQKRLVEARDVMDAQITFNARMLEINTDTTQKISSAWDLSKGPLGPQTLFKVLSAWKDHNTQLQAVAFEREAYEEQLRQQRIQQEVDAARQIRDERIDAIKEAFDKYKVKIEAEIELAEQARDTKVGILKEELDVLKENYRQEVDAVKAAYDAELSALKDKQSQEETALRATYDLKQSLLAQSTSDEIEAIAVLDRTRNEALERYRTAEVARLTATRDRILATLTDENEKRAITEEYSRQIAAVHTEVEDAKLDKTKGVTLATKQLRNEEKEESVRLKTEEKTAIEKLQDDFQIKFKDLAEQRDKKLADMATEQKTREEALNAKIVEIQTAAANDIKRLKDDIANKDRQSNDAMTFENQKYRNFVIESNRAMLESQKAMAIAQLRAEIAILKGKRNIFNSGRINAAIGDIEGAIRELEGVGATPVELGDAFADRIKSGFIAQNKNNKTPFNSDTMQAVTEAFDRSGNVITLTYTDEDREFVAYDKSGNAFKLRNAYGLAEKTGEKFFKGSEWVDGIGYPEGIDTVPAWLTKGERVLPTSLNEKLGPQVSNEELVKSYLKLDELKQKFGSVRIEEFGLLNFDTGNRVGNVMDVRVLEKKMDELIDVINSKPGYQINVDANHITVGEIGRNEQHVTYYENIFNK